MSKPLNPEETAELELAIRFHPLPAIREYLRRLLAESKSLTTDVWQERALKAEAEIKRLQESTYLANMQAAASCRAVGELTAERDELEKLYTATLNTCRSLNDKVDALAAKVKYLEELVEGLRDMTAGLED